MALARFGCGTGGKTGRRRVAKFRMCDGNWSPLAKDCSAVLGRQANEKPFLLLPVGYPAEDAQVPDITKKPLSESAIFVE